jgi:hypothetical protein
MIIRRPRAPPKAQDPNEADDTTTQPTHPADESKEVSSMISYGSSGTFKDTENSNPKLQAACDACVGYIKNCDYCGQKIEILNGKPLNYHEGSLHRCGRPRY